MICLMTLQWGKKNDVSPWHLHVGLEKKRVCPSGKKKYLIEMKSCWVKECSNVRLTPFSISVVTVCVCSVVSDSATPRTGAHQAPLSVEFPRQEYWSGLPFSSPGNLPDPGIEPMSLVSPALQVDSIPLAPPGKPISHFCT